MKWRTEIEEGQSWGRYGFAWYDWEREVKVGYLWPLNLPIGWGRWLWIKLRYSLQPPRRYEDSDAYLTGYGRGYDAGATWDRRQAAVRQTDYSRGLQEGMDKGYAEGWRKAFEKIESDLLGTIEARRKKRD